MKVLVTGASGFIGQAVCRALLDRGDEVSALVRSQWSLPGLSIVRGDLDDLQAIEQGLVGVDCVIHLAGRAHLLNDSASDPLAEFRRINCAATVRLAELARDAGVGRFVFLSSIGVNGSHTLGRPFDETSSVQPHAPYAVSKLEAEQGLSTCLGGSVTSYVIIRPPLVYAANAPGNFQRLLKLVASGAPLPFGMVRNRRNMVSLESLVDFILLASAHREASNQCYLVADTESVSTRDITDCLGQGMERRVINLPIPEVLLGGLMSAVGKASLKTQLCGSLEVDNRKARSLGWQPRHTAQEALKATGRNFRNV